MNAVLSFFSLSDHHASDMWSFLGYSQAKCAKPHQDDSHGLVSIEETVPIFLQNIP